MSPDLEFRESPGKLSFPNMCPNSEVQSQKHLLEVGGPRLLSLNAIENLAESPLCVWECPLVVSPSSPHSWHMARVQPPLERNGSKNNGGRAQIWPAETSQMPSAAAAGYWHSK